MIVGGCARVTLLALVKDHVMTHVFADVGFLGFDVFGTVVDWRSGIARAAAPFLERHGMNISPLDFADEWRSLYQPAMQRVRSGERPWVKLSILNRENLEAVLAKYGASFGS